LIYNRIALIITQSFRQEDFRGPLCNRTWCWWILRRTVEASFSETGATDNEMAGVW